MQYTLEFSEINMKSMPETGGRAAVLGELFNQPRLRGETVADGFVVTASAYRRYMAHNGLQDLSAAVLNDLDLSHLSNLKELSARARDRILAAEIPADVGRDITAALRRLLDRTGPDAALVARGNRIAGPVGWDAWKETPLQSQTALDGSLLEFCKEAFARLFTVHSLRYRLENASASEASAVSVQVRRGIPGTVASENPSDPDNERLNAWRARVEAHFGQPMHIEWMRHAKTGELFITEAWPSAISVI